MLEAKDQLASLALDTIDKKNSEIEFREACKSDEIVRAIREILIDCKTLCLIIKEDRIKVFDCVFVFFILLIVFLIIDLVRGFRTLLGLVLLIDP